MSLKFSLILLLPPSIYTSSYLLHLTPCALRLLVLFFLFLLFLLLLLFLLFFFSSFAILLLLPLPPLTLHLFSYSSLLVSSISFVSSLFSLFFLLIFAVRFCFLCLYPCPSFCCTFHFSFPVLNYTPVTYSSQIFITSSISCKLSFTFSSSDIFIQIFRPLLQVYLLFRLIPSR